MFGNKTLDMLLGDRNVGYGPRPFPDRRDRDISDFIDQFRRSDVAVRSSLIQQVSGGRDRYRDTLRAYAERMASYARITRDPAFLERGILALLIGQSPDWREDLLVMPLLYHSARRLGVSPDDLFRNAAQEISPEAAEFAGHFLLRNEDDKRIEAMGYVETDGKDGH